MLSKFTSPWPAFRALSTAVIVSLRGLVRKEFSQHPVYPACAFAGSIDQFRAPVAGAKQQVLETRDYWLTIERMRSA